MESGDIQVKSDREHVGIFNMENVLTVAFQDSPENPQESLKILVRFPWEGLARRRVWAKGLMGKEA